MSTLKVNTIEGITSNVAITAQSIADAKNQANTSYAQANTALALAIALGA